MKVLCSGLNVVDILVSTPSMVKIGQKNECEKIVMQGGAPAGNAACAMASMGFETSFLGYFGNNPLSLVSKRELTKHGVKEDFFISKEGASPAIAIVDIDEKGERTVFYSMSNYVPFSSIDFDETLLNDYDLILVDGYDTEINTHLLKLSKELGIKSILDMESADKNVMLQMLQLTTDAILPLETAQILSGVQDIIESLQIVSNMTEAQVVITDGANGSYAILNEQVIHQPAFKVKVVDTTGCGDSFHAAYASALLQHMELADRLTYASFYAAQVAQNYGGRTYLPNKEFMDNNCPVFIKS
jgi:sulfofructose kinase